MAMLAVLLAAAAAALAQPLALDAVLDAVEADLPALQAAEAKIAAAEAKLLSTSGAFDPTLSGKSSIYSGSDPRSLSVLTVGGETPIGARWSVGIRHSDGYVKPYETELETGEQGEWIARGELPLDQLGLPDSRAQRRVAGLNTEIAEQLRDDKRLELRYKAAAAYWKWASAGAKLEVEQAQLDLAEGRMRALEQQVALGSAPRMDLIDAQRARLERQARVVAAQADLEVAAQVLSLYYQQPVTAAQLPPLSVPASAAPLEVLLERAQQRPDLIALDRSLAAAQVTLRREQLDLLPDATLIGQVADDAALDKTEWLIGAELKLPLLMRKDRGSLAAAQAEVERLSAERRWLLAQIDADIAAARTAAEAARSQAAIIAETAAQAEEVLGMEQLRYEVGDSDLFKLILREDKLAEIRKYLAVAQAEAQIRQAALYRTVGGID